MIRPTDVDDARDQVDPVYCTCCERRLKGRVAWLELDTDTGRYHNPGEVDRTHSQGSFPFGVACATRILNEEETS